MQINLAYYFLLFALGACVGSFLNVCVCRSKSSKNIIIGRSQCDSCGEKLKAIHLVPILSFIFFKAKSKCCNKKISFQHPLVEFCVGMLFVFVARFHSLGPFVFSPEFARDAIILSLLVFIFVYDLIYMEILDKVTIIPAIILLCLSYFIGWNSSRSMLIGVIVGGGFFLIQYILSKGKWIGAGDIRLGMFMGIILGWPVILTALLLSYLFGAVFSAVFLLLGHKTKADKVPFGAFLSAATAVCMFYGNNIMFWYLNFLH